MTPSSLGRESVNFGARDGRNVSSTSLGDFSLYSTSYPGESSNVIVGPGGVLAPRSSILLNPSKKKTFVDAWRTGDGTGPAVLHIPAVQTTRDRELEKEKERIAREKEIERELKEKEQAEKVWGIPKKAFYMGLGEINFNAQMAILGGWGNGSGPATDFRPNMAVPLPLVRGPTMTRRPSSRSERGRGSSSRQSSSKGKGDREKSRREREKQREKEKQQAIEREQAVRKQREKEEGEESDSSMDLEELASLNAIINTRRSMEAAQALASGQHKMPTIKKSISHASLSVSSTARPSLSAQRKQSNDTVPSHTPSIDYKSSNNNDSPVSFGEKPNVSRTSSEIFKQQARIRFAPLPQAYGAALLNNGNEVEDLSFQGAQGGSFENLGAEKSTEETEAGQDGSDDSEDDEPEEGDESWSRRLSGSRSKW